MPIMKLCAGCHGLVPKGVTRCPRCQGRKDERDRQRKAAYEARRPARAVPTWAAAWRKLSREQLALKPFCEVCGAKATEVHHRVPVRVDPSRALDPSNTACLCRSCHSRITASEGGAYGNPRR